MPLSECSLNPTALLCPYTSALLRQQHAALNVCNEALQPLLSRVWQGVIGFVEPQKLLLWVVDRLK